MRIIGGRWSGQTIVAPKGHHTHPMSEKMRGALFNMLGDIVGLVVLDAFAGSGALGLEALSRGAASVQALDNDRQAAETITLNAHKLGAKNVHISQVGVYTWLTQHPNVLFDLIVADPPYDKLQIDTIAALPAHLREGGLLVLSWPKDQPVLLSLGLEHLATKSYGDGTLVIYRKI